MRNDLLKRDYPLSETRIGDREKKKKASDAKAAAKVESDRIMQLRMKEDIMNAPLLKKSIHEEYMKELKK